MKKIFSVAICMAGVFAFLCCNPPPKTATQSTGDNSRSSLDWDGIYRGTLPCADCEGIQTTVYLNKDLNYKLKLKYLGKQDSATEYTGNFTWNKEGSTITIPDAGGMTYRYLVGENTLTHLDINGNSISGDLANRYILSKENYALLEKYWKLVELNGNPIAVDSSFIKEPHIIFKEADSRFNGNGGCNNISGRYELLGMNRITISQAISTQMACPKMELESEFLKALQMADNFTINADMLVLNKAKMAPLARFKTVYMK